MTWSGAWSAARSQRPISGASRWPRRASGRSWSGTSGQADLACRINSSDTDVNLGEFTRLGLLTVPAALLLAVVALWASLTAIGG